MLGSMVEGPADSFLAGLFKIPLEFAISSAPPLVSLAIWRLVLGRLALVKALTLVPRSMVEDLGDPFSSGLIRLPLELVTLPGVDGLPP